MKVVIAGGTGFLGQPLARALATEGRDVVVLTRDVSATTSSQRPHPRIRFIAWNPADLSGGWTAEVNGAVVVNLAGESIGGRRWSAAQKERILESRIQATRGLAHAVRRAAEPAVAFISGSAVGYYGPLDGQIVREEHLAGTDFLARVCERWEAEAIQAVGGATRVACLRTGLALEKDGGALARMLTPFRLGVGGRLGSGRQYWPWIHRADWIALVRWAIDTTSASGAFNATAPHPVTNAAFTRALGKALRRPAILPAPAFALRIAFGEMADALLLASQNAVPARAERLGFSFQYPNLDTALEAILLQG